MLFEFDQATYIQLNHRPRRGYIQIAPATQKLQSIRLRKQKPNNEAWLHSNMRNQQKGVSPSSSSASGAACKKVEWQNNEAYKAHAPK